MSDNKALTSEQRKIQEKLRKTEAKEQADQFKTLIKQKSELVKRTKHDVKDDVKYGVLPKSALIIEPLHKIGVPTGAITSGVIAFGDMSAFMTMSDKKLCEYYAHYDEIVKSKKQSVSSIVKAVDKQEESLMSAKADLAASKLRYSSFQTKLKLEERLAKVACANATNSTSDETNGPSAEAVGQLADGFGIDV